MITSPSSNHSSYNWVELRDKTERESKLEKVSSFRIYFKFIFKFLPSRNAKLEIE